MISTSDIIFRIEETSDLPIWAQLRNRITYLIRTGYFKEGDQLPSVRSLAADATINYNTVAKAYHDLELGGLIVSVRGRGMFVKGTLAQDNEKMKATNVLLENCVQEYKSVGMNYAEIRAHVASYISELERIEQDGQ